MLITTFITIYKVFNICMHWYCLKIKCASKNILILHDFKDCSLCYHIPYKELCGQALIESAEVKTWEQIYMYNCFPLQISCGKLQSPWKRTLSTTAGNKENLLERFIRLWQRWERRRGTRGLLPQQSRWTKQTWEPPGFLSSPFSLLTEVRFCFPVNTFWVRLLCQMKGIPEVLTP